MYELGTFLLHLVISYYCISAFWLWYTTKNSKRYGPTMPHTLSVYLWGEIGEGSYAEF